MGEPAPAETGVQIYVDGDACPVKSEVVRVAGRHGLVVYLVANRWLRGDDNPLVKRVVVPDGADAADTWIAEHIREHDIAITADIPLAARCLARGAAVIGPTGKPFTDNGIGMALALRDLRRELDEMGRMARINPPFSPRDRSTFLQVLERTVVAKKRSRAAN